LKKTKAKYYFKRIRMRIQPKYSGTRASTPN
jgi:hypothetical protein